MRLKSLLLMLLLLAVPLARAATLKIATVVPEGTQWMQEMRKGADEIAQRTGGRVTLKFYSGGVMGSDRVVLRKIRAGQLQGGALTGGALAELYPGAALYSLPMLFRSYTELDYVRARMDHKLAQGLEAKGFVTFGFADGGFAYIMSVSPVRSIADLKSQKIWVPEGDQMAGAMFDTLGAASVPLPITDVLTGLQTGLITTVGAPAPGAIALQWHTRVKYLVTVPTMYIYGAMAVDKKAFQQLSPADQAVVREVMGRVYATLNSKARQDDQSALAALREQGVQFVDLSQADIARLRASAGQTIDRLVTQGTVPQDLVKELRRDLEAFRSAKHPR